MRLLALLTVTLLLSTGGCADTRHHVGAVPPPDEAQTGWYPGPASSEHADSARSHLFRAIAAPSSSAIESGTPIGNSLLKGLPSIYNFATGDADALFVYGGIGVFGSAPYVARVDTDGRSIVWKTELLPPGVAGEWNYPGVVGVHANGFVYAIHGYRLGKLDPRDGRIVASLELPTPQAPRDVAYNGFIVLPGGTIVAKSYHRKPGCKEDGFRAVMMCGLDGTPNSLIVAVDPNTMKIVSTATAPELIGGRISATRYRGTDYIYAPGVDRLLRFSFAGGRLAFDESWRPQPYRRGKQTAGTAATFLGDFVIVQSNALPSTDPLSLTAVSQADAGREFRFDPFPDSNWSMIPSMPSVDPDTNMIYTVDGLAGRIAGVRFSSESGFRTIWQDRQASFGFSALVGPRRDRTLIGSSATDVKSFNDYGSDHIIWRDAATGVVRATSPAVGRIGGAVIGVNTGGRVYSPAVRDDGFTTLTLSTSTRSR